MATPSPAAVASAQRAKTVVQLFAKDFRKGPVLIRKPGRYVLQEDVTFRPNAKADLYPTSKQRAAYQPFVLGFFAAIIVLSDDVEIDLNGKLLEQSREHALQQRFYAHICLGPAPFVPGTGEANFIRHRDYFAVKRATVHSGRLGRSSHHGILSNDTDRVTLHHLTITDFEIAAIALNGGQHHSITHCELGPSSRDVPVHATYSAGRFIRQFVRAIAARDPKATFGANGGPPLNGATLLKRLEARLDAVFHEVLRTGTTSDAVFGNKDRLNEGTQYGLVIHPRGPATGGIDVGRPTIQRVDIDHVNVRGLLTMAKPILGLSVPAHVQAQAVPKAPHAAQVDAAGAQIYIDAISDAQGRYLPNPLADAQLFVAKHAAATPAERGRSTIALPTIEWAEGKRASPLAETVRYLGGGDFMFHVLKPAYGMRLEGIAELSVTNCELVDLEQRGRYPSDQLVKCGAPAKPHPDATTAGMAGPDMVGLGLSANGSVVLANVVIANVRSWYGNALAVQTFTGGTVQQKNVQTADIHSATKLAAA